MPLLLLRRSTSNRRFSSAARRAASLRKGRDVTDAGARKQRRGRRGLRDYAYWLGDPECSAARRILNDGCQGIADAGYLVRVNAFHHDPDQGLGP